MGSVCCSGRGQYASSGEETRNGFVDHGIHQWRDIRSMSPPVLSTGWEFTGPRPSSYSSSSKGGSRSRSRNHSARHRINDSWVLEGNLSYFSSSPSESFHGQGWNMGSTGQPDMALTSAFQESRPGSSAQSYKEGYVVAGTCARPASTGSVSSHSEMGDYERNPFTHVASQSKPFSCRCSFMSKAVHPMPQPMQTVDADSQEAHMSSVSNRSPSTEHRSSFRSDNSAPHDLKSFEGPSEYGSPQVSPEYIRLFHRNRFVPSSTNASEFSSPVLGPRLSVSEGLMCRICNKWLSQKSPWSSHRMIKSSDFPPSSVLCCGHVYHADCLEQMIPELLKHDPPCPVCDGVLNHTGHTSSFHGIPHMPSESSVTSSRRFIDNSSISPSRSNSNNPEGILDVQQRKKNSQSPASTRKSLKSFSKKMFFWAKANKKTPVTVHRPMLPSSMHMQYSARSNDKFSAGYSRG